jgi:hypothetical protein
MADHNRRNAQWGGCHHPHAHIIVPGGGVSLDGERWIACRPGFLLPVRVLSRLFRCLFLEGLNAAYQAGRLQFFANQGALAQPAAFQTFLAPLRKVEWVALGPHGVRGPRCCCSRFPAQAGQPVLLARARSTSRKNAASTIPILFTSGRLIYFGSYQRRI